MLAFQSTCVKLFRVVGSDSNYSWLHTIVVAENNRLWEKYPRSRPQAPKKHSDKFFGLPERGQGCPKKLWHTKADTVATTSPSLSVAGKVHHSERS